MVRDVKSQTTCLFRKELGTPYAAGGYSFAARRTLPLQPQNHELLLNAADENPSTNVCCEVAYTNFKTSTNAESLPMGERRVVPGSLMRG